MDSDLDSWPPPHWPDTQKLYHKFVFSEFIQNCWHSGCDIVDVVADTPDTFLVHGLKGYAGIENRTHLETRSGAFEQRPFVLVFVGVFIFFVACDKKCRLRRCLKNAICRSSRIWERCTTVDIRSNLLRGASLEI